MMGRGHAVTSALGGMIVGVNLLSLDPVNLAVFTAMTTGFGLAPDIDEPKSTISRQFGVISRPVSMAARRIAGGHRVATHSWIANFIAVGIGLLGLVIPIFGALLSSMAFVLAIRTILPARASDEAGTLIVAASAVGLFVGLSPTLDPSVMLLAPLLGVLIHQLGDLVTPQGIPLFWPSQRRVSLNLFKTNSPDEHNVVVPISFVALAFLAISHVISPISSWVYEGGLETMMQGYSGVSEGLYVGDGPAISERLSSSWSWLVSLVGHL